MKITKQAALDYCLNRFCPYITIICLLFSEFRVSSPQPYCIVLLVWFIERFSFSVGHSCGTYENDPKVREEIDRELEEDEL
jgi:hypothetical protein